MNSLLTVVCFSTIDPTQSCTRKHKRHGCSANANVQSNQCRVPNVDNIQYATVHNAVAGHVCNPTSYPLAANATESYTWDGQYIYMDDDCRAVFNVYYDECEPGELFEPPRGKTNNVVSEQVRHKPACTVTEDGKKLEILELSRGGIVLSE